jgi:hypothetical protein
MLRAETKSGVLETEIRFVLCLVSVTLLEREECAFSMIRLLAEVCVVCGLVSIHQGLVEGWGQFLSKFPWDWFVTLTFRDPVGSFRAHRLFGYFVRDLERAAGIPIFWFHADEIGPRGGRFHIHALIGNVAHLRRMTWVDRWDGLAGYARILPFNAKRGAAYYTAKYVAKQNGDWEISDNLAAFGQYQPVLSLDGMTKPKPAEPIVPVAAPGAQRSRPEPTRQFPLATGQSSSLRGKDLAIEEIYRSEVTRGRGRFRNFFPRSTDE